MFQGTFALFNRALCVDFRLTRTHLFRFLFAVMILFCLVSAHLSSQFLGAAGLALFAQIIYLNFIFILMAGISFFATAITEEKEEQTIGLLLMAGVNPIALLLGKSLPRLVSALLLLSVQFPFTLLAITLGGVTFSQVIAAYAALAVFLFCLSNLGLICSVVCTRSRAASTLVVLSLITYFLGPLLLTLLLDSLIHYRWIADGTMPVVYAERAIEWLGQTSVLNQTTVILTSGFNESPWGIQFWSNFCFGVFLFLFASLLFNRFALSEVSVSPGRGALSTKKNNCFSPGRTWENALMWKDFFFVNGGYGMTCIKFVGYGIALIALCSFIRYTSHRYTLEECGLTLFWSMLIVVLIEISLFSSRIYHVEIQWNTLTSTAMLPISMSQIAYSKLAGALLSLVPACAYLLLGCLFAFENIIENMGEILPEPGFWMMVVEVLFFWHLTAFLSTYIKWGALPLAFVLMLVGNMMLGIFISLMLMGSSSGDGEGLSLIFTLAMSVGIVISHFLINERLSLLASR